jgi:pyruvate, water dikinase
MKFISLFEEVGIGDIAKVGGKNASLGEMIQKLTPLGLSIPSGFIVTADSFLHHLKENKLEEKIKSLLDKLNKEDLKAFAHIGHEIRSIIRTAPLPTDLVEEIKTAYKQMEEKYGEWCDVAVRSSATAEDLPEASFAGQQETFLNIQGEAELLRACSDAFSSLYTDRAISYRMDHGFEHMSVAISLGIQKMVRSDKSSAGVIFTLDTESGFKDVVFITSSYGLGENVVKGTVNPDEFYVHKPTLEKGFKPLLKKRLGRKSSRLIYAEDERSPVKNVAVPRRERMRFSISDEEALELARQSLIIEKHYSERKGSWCPMDIEWAKDGDDGKLYIVQARPETVHSNTTDKTFLEEYLLTEKQRGELKIISKGKSVGRKISTGKARVLSSISSMHSIQEGDILVTDMTDPDWEPIMKKAAGIITDRGGRTCHAAIISRELGIPAIVGTRTGSREIKDGQEITMDCSEGDTGFIYDGPVPFEIKKVEIKKIPKLDVDIMMNVANPDSAFSFAQLPNDGVGLARLEFIINSTILVHPMALIHTDKVEDYEEYQKIQGLTVEYEDKKQFFIDRLAQEAGTIAAAFYPKPVIIRMSDFKSNEYSKLLAGKYFEPEEENPMLGFRGASRYYHEKYKEAFALECLAMKKIRNEMGLDNVKLMIPFVRTVKEGAAVIEVMKEHGLVQGENGLEIYMMTEIPSNVLLIEEFSKVFDGFSIGSNDLTQTTLAVDRDSSLVASLFDERNEAVKKILKMAIDGAKKSGKKIGICGQAPSDYPEMAEFLVKCGIDSMSLNPDSVVNTIMALGKK